MDNDNGVGMELMLFSQYGTNLTGSFTNNAWSNWSSSERTQDQTLTWYATNNATYEITGVQLEVGSFPSDFQFKSFAEELALCQRYFERIVITGNDIFFYGVNQFGSQGRIPLYFRVTKRAIPTVSIDDANFAYYAVAGSGSNGSGSFAVNSYSKDTMGISSVGTGSSTAYWTNKSNDGYVDASAEL